MPTGFATGEKEVGGCWASRPLPGQAAGGTWHVVKRDLPGSDSRIHPQKQSAAQQPEGLPGFQATGEQGLVQASSGQGPRPS